MAPFLIVYLIVLVLAPVLAVALIRLTLAATRYIDARRSLLEQAIETPRPRGADRPGDEASPEMRP